MSPLASLRAHLVPACLALAGLAVLPARAQRADEPFGEVTFRLGGTRNLNRNFLHAFWKQGTGVEAGLATPFYLGFLEFGGAYHRFEAEQDVPNFDALLLYTGWGLGVGIRDRIRLESSARVGTYRMSFDDDTFPGIRHESELAVMANARLAVRPWGPVSVYVSGSYLKVYTFLRLKLWFASAGVSYRLQSLTWLKDLLR